MNPSVIAIGGSMARVGEHLIAGVREVVYTRSMPLATEHLAIVQSVAAQNAAVLGASMLAIEHVLSPETLATRSEEHTSELQSLMRISYAVFCLKKKRNHTEH